MIIIPKLIRITERQVLNQSYQLLSLVKKIIICFK